MDLPALDADVIRDDSVTLIFDRLGRAARAWADSERVLGAKLIGPKDEWEEAEKIARARVSEFHMMLGDARLVIRDAIKDTPVVHDAPAMADATGVP
jgi:hypothetical protein